MGSSQLDGLISEKANLLLRGRSNITMLEAGCGSASYFHFADVTKAVGIDISQDQLDKNTAVDEKILGDLQTYPLLENAFDIVVCWDVIEHLPRPKEALLNMFKGLRPGGLLILGFPNLASFKGIVTKLTPFWFHRLFYRYMKYSSRHFPTYLRAAILPERVTKLAEDHGFSVIFQSIFEGGVTKRFKQRFRAARWSFAIADSLWHLLSAGRSRSLSFDNCALILRKGDAVTARGDAPQARARPGLVWKA